jgi:hypothetical protein
MKPIIDLNKTAEGEENLVVGEHTAVELDAIKAAAILKNKIRAGESEKKRSVSETKKLRRLIIRSFAVTQAEAAAGGSVFSGGCLSINLDALREAGNAARVGLGGYIKDFSVRLFDLKKDPRNFAINSVLDFSPVAAKVQGGIGEGISHDFSRFCVMLTAVEEKGFQPANMGASNGIFGERVRLGRPGTPDASDCILNVDVILKDGHARSREGIAAAHALCDAIVRPLRDLLRALPSPEASNKAEYWDTVRSGGYKIALVKLVPGLGCLYDTVLFPEDPAGYAGGKSIMDRSHNMQIPVTPNEYRDGAVHSLT